MLIRIARSLLNPQTSALRLYQYVSDTFLSFTSTIISTLAFFKTLLNNFSNYSPTRLAPKSSLGDRINSFPYTIKPGSLHQIFHCLLIRILALYWPFSRFGTMEGLPCICRTLSHQHFHCLSYYNALKLSVMLVSLPSHLIEVLFIGWSYQAMSRSKTIWMVSMVLDIGD